MRTRKVHHVWKSILGVALVAGMTAVSGSSASWAADKVVKIGITMPITGADAKSAIITMHAAQMAIKEFNESGALPGYTIESVVYNNATSTAGQYDPAQAATNTKKLVADPLVVANVGPIMSGDGKAMSPILSEADMATITPASTNPDITDPKYQGQFDPSGKAVYFRTVTTDAYQGPNMANFYKDNLHVKTVYILDDSGAYGVGLANAFEAQAKKIGIKVVGRDRLDPLAADYTTILTKIKALNPDAIYYGGVGQAGVKLVKQAYQVIPNVIKGGGDGLYGSDILTGAGFPADEGWYVTIASPHIVGQSKVEPWIKKFEAAYNEVPDDYAVTSYDATNVILDAIKKVVESGKPVTRSNVRDAIQNEHLETLQGMVSFDKNGDLQNKVISVFQMHHDPNYPVADSGHQYKYIGVAPQSPMS